jgi:enamine deaminase RidA (YjgF/YER057c/UK114 family)
VILVWVFLHVKFLILSLFLAQSLPASDYFQTPAFECRDYAACLNQLPTGQIVATTVFLANIADYPAMNTAYEQRFPGLKPARNTVQVQLPQGIRMAINATVYTGPATPQGLTPPGVTNVVPITPAIRTPDRLFIAGILGRDSNTGTIPNSPEAQIEMCLARLRNVLHTAGRTRSQLLQATVYHTAAIPRPLLDQALANEFGPAPAIALTTLQVPALALNANIAINGIADTTQDLLPHTSTPDAIIKALYDAISGPPGQPRNWDLLRAILHPSARFQTIRPNGQTVTWTTEEYITRNEAPMVQNGFWERELSRKSLSGQRLTTVHSEFGISAKKNAEPTRRGTNIVTLSNEGTRWWIMSVYWETTSTL